MKDFIKHNKTIVTIAIILFILPIVLFGTHYFLKINQSPTVKKSNTPKIRLDMIKDEVDIEVNSQLPNISEYFKNTSDLNDFPVVSYYKNGNKIDVDLSKIAEYDVKILYQKEEYASTLKVIDKTPPIVNFKELSIKEGTRYIGRNFIQTYYDNSGDKNYLVSYKNNEDANINKPGSYDINLSVCDTSKNCTEGVAKLNIYTDDSNRKYLSSETKTITTKDEPVKYGVTKKTTIDITYALYDDGSKEEITRNNEIIEYDYSNFSRDYLHEMKQEATLLYKEQQSTRLLMLDKVNSYRQEAGVKNLQLDPKLSVLATVRAMEMAYGNKYSHRRPYIEKEWQSWSSFWKEDIFDFPFDYSKFLGENVGHKYNEDKNMIEAWRQSESEYAVMVEPKYSKIGIGKYTFNGVNYWVQLFIE